MEKIKIITNQPHVDTLIIAWLRSAFPQFEIDIIHWKGENLEDHPLLKAQNTDGEEGLTRKLNGKSKFPFSLTGKVRERGPSIS
jgi:hypothetical protein